MLNTRLILFEGIPGSGKTTTSQLLQEYILSIGIDATVFVEGSKHPIDLPFHAYLLRNEFEDVLNTYHQQEEWLKRNSIIENEYVLIPYKIPEPKPINAELVDFLYTKEFCYSSKPVVSFEKFKEVFVRRLKRFADSSVNNNDIVIFESVLFQHQIHDINRLYPHIKDSEIIAYMAELAEILHPLNPVLFYLSQVSVREALEHTAQIRSKPNWSTAESIDYYTYRKSLELDIIKSLPIESTIIDNSARDWNIMFESIIRSLNLKID